MNQEKNINELNLLLNEMCMIQAGYETAGTGDAQRLDKEMADVQKRIHGQVYEIFCELRAAKEDIHRALRIAYERTPDCQTAEEAVQSLVDILKRRDIITRDIHAEAMYDLARECGWSEVSSKPPVEYIRERLAAPATQPLMERARQEIAFCASQGWDQQMHLIADLRDALEAQACAPSSIAPTIQDNKKVAAIDSYLTSPFRRKHYDGEVDVQAVEWAISLLQIDPGVEKNPNSQMWLDRLRANLHHYKASAPASIAPTKVRYCYSGEVTIANRDAVWASGLANIGDAILVWVNQGDILEHGERIEKEIKK